MRSTWAYSETQNRKPYESGRGKRMTEHSKEKPVSTPPVQCKQHTHRSPAAPRRGGGGSNPNRGPVVRLTAGTHTTGPCLKTGPTTPPSTPLQADRPCRSHIPSLRDGQPGTPDVPCPSSLKMSSRRSSSLSFFPRRRFLPPFPLFFPMVHPSAASTEHNRGKERGRRVLHAYTWGGQRRDV